MSTSESKINPDAVGWSKPDSGSPTSQGISTATTSSSTKPTINLTTLDKIKRFFFSKEEWEAYLIEKLEEQEKKKERPIRAKRKWFFGLF
ncbi:uncharacterized protein LOC107359210 isoform X2 [Tetranychus urticae]|uniref:uncharacterized protein LOC107359210 isoform X2 n=1 Tax=Tetranychus urticae TaxID=32264 RepID=UPI00077BF2DE|nr:uncharacterized protein LOC107359210 isoform X2 [Tetranychus urticae]